jgi:hypothetical protein
MLLIPGDSFYIYVKLFNVYLKWITFNTNGISNCCSNLIAFVLVIIEIIGINCVKPLFKLFTKSYFY